MGESTNGIRVELNRLSKAGLLCTEKDGRTIKYKANTKHSLFSDLHSLVLKYTGIDQLIDIVIAHLGNVEIAFITGDYAQGIDSGLIDLVIVGDVDKNYLQLLVDKSEQLINRKIRTLVFSNIEFERYKRNLDIDNALIVWEAEDKRS
ncbi:MAG: ArsR family transcriptional regulator [Peptococcaceae bacterium]|nr:ArsR family transcriptional regulator [Peptococcaceae bacterium]